MITKKIIRNLSDLKLQLSITVLFLMSLGMSSGINAQGAGAKEEIYVTAEEAPAFPGGPKALLDFIYKKITYPEDAKEQKIEGKVIVRFVVDKDGNVTQPTIARGLSPSIDKEVLNVIGKLPKFTPGKIGGKAVSVWYAVPISFRIV